MTSDLSSLLNFVQQLAKRVGVFINDQQENVRIVEYKDRQDIVTNIDIDAEELFVEAIKKEYPSHSILSEEQGSDSQKSDFRWVIDPIDGTKEYIRGLPFWNVSFALEHKDELIVSVVFKPNQNTMYSSAKGLGSFENGSSVNPSSQKSLKDSFIFTKLPSYNMSSSRAKIAWKQLSNLSKNTYRLRSLAEEAISMCWVASGKIEGYVNLGTINEWYDVAPGLTVALHSKATITDLRGKPFEHHRFSEGFIVSNGHVHDRIIKTLQV